MATAPSIMIVAGEASADAHGAQVIAALREKRPDLEIFGIGGVEMREQELDTVANAEDISVAGLTEVLLALPRIWGIMRRLVAAARERRPAVAVLIDLPDFNMRVARKLKKLGIPVVYYISPQVWAWRKSRVKEIRDLVSQMLVVLPFEQNFYQEHGVRVRFVGHPLIEQLPLKGNRSDARAELGLPPTQGPVVALLPGSRKKEVSRHLPRMLHGILLLRRRFPEIHPIIPVASTIPRKVVESIVRRSGIMATILDGQSTEALIAADVALVCSGTATLQAALLSRPMVVVYRVSWLSYQILKRMVKVAHIGLVNLIVGRRLVPELVQDDFTAQKVESELGDILSDPVVRVRLNQDFAALRRQLGGPGASKRVADAVLGYVAGKAVEVDEKTGQLWG